MYSNWFFYLVIVLPQLVALGTVTGIEDDLTSGVIQAGLVSPDLAVLGQHPVLVAALQTKPKFGQNQFRTGHMVL